MVLVDRLEEVRIEIVSQDRRPDSIMPHANCQAESQRRIACIEKIADVLIHEITDERVRKIRLESVAHFHAKPPAGHIVKEKDTARILAPSTDLQLLHPIDRSVLDR